MAFSIASAITFTPPTIWQCSPVTSFWDRSIPHTCLKTDVWRMVFSVCNIVTDILILILPIHQILHLQLELRDKDPSVCATSIIRVTTVAGSDKEKDPLWIPAPLAIWSVIEVNTGIVCACMPMIRQPLSLFFPKVFSARRTEDYCSGKRSVLASHLKSCGAAKENLTLTDSTICWTRHDEENLYMASIKRGRNSMIHRTESSEPIVDSEEIDLSDRRIFQRTEVSMTHSMRT
ncbi:hypothetical protein LOZ58_001540 [Ophidiomyces ophidiicola]|nr:hypothetical protein LOZ58_001540 [Ophidiomyces ophidiicola]